MLVLFGACMYDAMKLEDQSLPSTLFQTENRFLFSLP